MIFISHVRCEGEDSINGKVPEEVDRVVLVANSFAEAAGKVEKFYGNDLIALELLEPVGDSNDLIFLTAEAEQAIREHRYNAF